MIPRLLINFLPPGMPMPRSMPTQFGRASLPTTIPFTTIPTPADIEMGNVISHGLAGIIATSAIAAILLIFLGLWLARRAGGSW